MRSSLQEVIIVFLFYCILFIFSYLIFFIFTAEGEDEKELEEKAEEGEQSLPRLWSEEDNNVPLSLADDLLSVDPLTFTPLHEEEPVQQAPPCANLCAANFLPPPYSDALDQRIRNLRSGSGRRKDRGNSVAVIELN